MISKSLLQKAAQNNIIETEQVDPLFQFLQEQTQPAAQSNGTEEPLKFIRGFGDVFITLGVILLVIPINMSNLAGYYYLIPVAGFVVVAEWLVRLRRLSLPGIAIFISILYFANKVAVFEFGSSALYQITILCTISFAFYLRYKMPFSLLPLAAGLVAITILQLHINIVEHPLVVSGFGVLVFSVALWFDSQDTQRQSNLSQNAFWLHLLAAPLIVHGVMVSLLLSDHALVELISKEVFIIIFFSAFFLLALLIDRRAMLISTQLYMIYALTQILKENLTSGQNVMIYVLIVLGLFVIYFGAYWYKTRHLVFGFLSGSSIGRYIPDLYIDDTRRKNLPT